MKTTTLPGGAVAGKATAHTSFLGRRFRTALLAVSALALAMAPAMEETATAAPVETLSYTASAFGTSVSVGTLVKSGPSANVTLGCTTNGNLHNSNTTGGLNLPPFAKSGTVSTTADSFTLPARSKATAATQQVSLLSGLVRATAIKAASSTTRVSTGYSLSSEGTTLTGLSVAGITVRADAAPNTRINLPAGLGYVIVNEQVRRSNGLTVNGLHLFVTGTNALGIAVGTEIVVSQAVSALSGPILGVVSGNAYGSFAKVGSAVLSGETFIVYTPCLGTGGALRSNSGAGVKIGTVAQTGTITNSVRATVAADSASSEATSNVQAANLVNGLVKASAIKANARVSKDGSSYVGSSAGSGFGSLTVAGNAAINANVAPNTKVTIAGVGTLYLHRVIRTEKTVSVIMIQLVLTSPVNGLAVGTDIRVAAANATVS